MLDHLQNALDRAAIDAGVIHSMCGGDYEPPVRAISRRCFKPSPPWHPSSPS
jgi:hypothetical protein